MDRAIRLLGFVPARTSGFGRTLSSWIQLGTFGLVIFSVLSVRVYGQGTVTTNDGLTLSLSSSGSVSALKVNGTNYGSSGMASGFCSWASGAAEFSGAGFAGNAGRRDGTLCELGHGGSHVGPAASARRDGPPEDREV